MIVVLAGSCDQGARTLIDRGGTDRVALLTCADLSVPGWRHYLSSPGTSVAVIGGQQVALEDITGVVTCLPTVFELELLHIVPSDRSYVAAEMTAFLLYWLSALDCPVVNRPSPTCLCGPYWRQEQWAHIASQIGMRVEPAHRRVALYEEPTWDAAESTTVTVVGERCVGHVDITVMAAARRLARAANVEVLTVRVSGAGPDAVFLGADPRPDLSCHETADAVLEYMADYPTFRVNN